MHLPAASSAAADEPVANLLDRVGGDRKLASQIIRTFLLDTPKRMAEIQNALKRKDGEKTASLAHALKGAVGVFGVDAACHRSQNCGTSPIRAISPLQPKSIHNLRRRLLNYKQI